jgi:hypothetical protein
MPKTTLAVMRETIEERTKRADTLADALNLALTTLPDAVQKIREGSNVYTLSLYGATRAHGGIVVVRFDCPGQLPSISARHFDDYRQEYAVLSAVDFMIACERLAVVRRQLLDTDGPFRPKDARIRKADNPLVRPRVAVKAGRS